MKFELLNKNLKKIKNFEYEIYKEEVSFLEDIHIVQDLFDESKDVFFKLNCLEE